MCAKCHSDRTDRRRNRTFRVERNLMRNININFHFLFHRERHTKQDDTQRKTNERKYEKLFCCDDLLWDENLTTTQRRTHSHSSWSNRFNATCDMPVYSTVNCEKCSSVQRTEVMWCVSATHLSPEAIRNVARARAREKVKEWMMVASTSSAIFESVQAFYIKNVNDCRRLYCN